MKRFGNKEKNNILLFIIKFDEKNRIYFFNLFMFELYKL